MIARHAKRRPFPWGAVVAGVGVGLALVAVPATSFLGVWP